MSRAWLLGLLIFAALAAGFVTLRGGEFALAVPPLLLLAYAIVAAPPAMQLEVHRELSAERVTDGDPVEVRVRVKNSGGRLDELDLKDELPSGLELVEGSTQHLLSLRGGELCEFSYTVRGPRGGYSFLNIRATASDTLGLLPISSRLSTPAKLMILPTITRVRSVPIRPRRTRVYAGSIPARVGGSGIEFFGLRPYELGDSARRINWRAAARHPESMYSNEFQQERVADVAVVLDGRERVDLRVGGLSLFEFSVSAAGSIASALLRDGNRVGLLIYSHYLHWTLPGYGRIQRERIMQSLASAATGGSQVFEGLQYLPTRLFPPESQIVLVSPILEDDLPTLIQLRARGYQVMVVCPDPITLELSGLGSDEKGLSRADIELGGRIVRLERAVALGRLRRAGVQVVEWDVNVPFDQAMLAAFRRVRIPRTAS